MTKYEVKLGNVTKEPSDILLLKYAQNFYGADRQVASELVERKICQWTEIQPKPGEYKLVETKGTIAPRLVMFSGTPTLPYFGYDEMMVFACKAIEKIQELNLNVRVITTTVHGSGYGLDSGESLRRLIEGFRQGLSGYLNNSINRIIFLTLGGNAVKVLGKVLEAIIYKAEGQYEENSIEKANNRDKIREDPTKSSLQVNGSAAPKPQNNLKVQESKKRKVFVAMPFSEDFQNVYDYGIYPAVNQSEMICERVDLQQFHGDIIEEIRLGIKNASLVVADLTDLRPNVFLEVGYAWGSGIPVVLVAKKGTQLPFDVSTHRCIFYGSFERLKEELKRLIKGIEPTLK